MNATSFRGSLIFDRFFVYCLLFILWQPCRSQPSSKDHIDGVFAYSPRTFKEQSQQFQSGLQVNLYDLYLNYQVQKEQYPNLIPNLWQHQLAAGYWISSIYSEIAYHCEFLNDYLHSFFRYKLGYEFSEQLYGEVYYLRNSFAISFTLQRNSGLWKTSYQKQKGIEWFWLSPLCYQFASGVHYNHLHKVIKLSLSYHWNFHILEIKHTWKPQPFLNKWKLSYQFSIPL